MYKYQNRMIVNTVASLAVLFFILISICLFKEQQVNDLISKKEAILKQKNEISLLTKDISQSTFALTKPYPKLFTKTNVLKNSLKQMLQKFHITEILFKEKNETTEYFDITKIEMKFSSASEQTIYDFIQHFQQETSGIVSVDTIKIHQQDKNKFATEILYSLYSVRDTKIVESVTVTPQNISSNIRESICLFPTAKSPKRYSLLCAIDNFQAYINDQWIKPGDILDNFMIKNIYYDSIDIQKDNRIINLKIGSSW
jgi:hypothetical protein